ncbi:MAG: response regulator transcription factor [Endozoicomonadaceae bacterium]|nr:response regulator transcription factor [Endozoicomonadaceae bacterium]
MQKASVVSTVFIIDHDRATRDSLKKLLDSIGTSTRLFNNATDFLNHYQHHWQGCLLIDVCLPDLCGFTLQNKLKQQHCHLPIIFMSAYGDIPMAVQALKSGALNFIQKPFRNQDIIHYIREALNHNIKQQDMLTNNACILKKINTLTNREYHILLALIEGHPNKKIAFDNHLSHRTVETHRSHIMKKMESTSFANLITQYLSVKTNIMRK